MYALMAAVGIREVFVREDLFRSGMGWFLLVFGVAGLGRAVLAKLPRRR
jgi:hypothetical protein